MKQPSCFRVKRIKIKTSVKTMYRTVADYGLLDGAALWLARAALNPSRLVASATKTGSCFHWHDIRG